MTIALFHRDLKIRFSHSDPAGIVYYPNYFDMFNAVIEDWFEAMGLDLPTQIAQHRRGFPTVHAECDFFIPSRMGETLTFSLQVADVGRSSVAIVIEGHAADGVRLRANLVMVVVSLDTNASIPVPDDLRVAFAAHADSRHESASATP